MLAPSQNTSTRTWPGLGGSDTDYAWALTFPPICEFAVFPLALWMTRRVPFTIPLLVGLSLLVVSGAMYALSKDVWFLIVGRGVMGMGGGLSIPALHTYMGEMGTAMDQVREKQGKKPRKFAVYIAFSFIMNGGCVVAFGEFFCYKRVCWISILCMQKYLYLLHLLFAMQLAHISRITERVSASKRCCVNLIFV